MSELKEATPEDILRELTTVKNILVRTESYKVGIISNVMEILDGVAKQVEGSINEA